MEKDSGSSLFELNLDAANSYTLRSAASWAKVLGVAGSILGVLMICFFTIMLVRLNNAPSYGYREEGFSDMFNRSSQGASLGIWIFIIAGMIALAGGILSFLFGNRINLALRSNDQDRLDKAFGALRNYFALRSISVIIVLLLFLLAFMSAITG